MNAAIEEDNPSSPRDLCTVLVIYDDAASRDRSMSACDYLVQQFWASVELKFHWWRTDFLEDPSLAGDATENAIASDLLIVCVGESCADSPTLKAWFENWMFRRQDREGALLDLSTGNRQSGLLRDLCSRGNFEYLTPAPARPPANAPHPAGSADLNFSAAIKDRRSHSRPPSHFGLNE